eukprot:CAMPEP_0202872208 /NCGR_PEP_ID=MMETSP1391-20130828/20707_1 /ASSEMBLY_ACC=CAM_ASM_000867 /TAXON_ID=1034604 /ORGANISM="Chlamydomonas leiostraca, Strain SAG 11-49" /LENGTH=109 /DNA_ID=CAMNT_0049553199 /DNA_START=588 /DNA_END=914 /DNA_ORIENTATION=-
MAVLVVLHKNSCLVCNKKACSECAQICVQGFKAQVRPQGIFRPTPVAIGAPPPAPASVLRLRLRVLARGSNELALALALVVAEAAGEAAQGGVGGAPRSPRLRLLPAWL